MDSLTNEIAIFMGLHVFVFPVCAHAFLLDNKNPNTQKRGGVPPQNGEGGEG